ncbi:MAG: hypothetical protein ACRCXZ_02620 [Patescibacteria group bacterium]
MTKKLLLITFILIAFTLGTTSLAQRALLDRDNSISKEKTKIEVLNKKFENNKYLIEVRVLPLNNSNEKINPSSISYQFLSKEGEFSSNNLVEGGVTSVLTSDINNKTITINAELISKNTTCTNIDELEKANFTPSEIEALDLMGYSLVNSKAYADSGAYDANIDLSNLSADEIIKRGILGDMDTTTPEAINIAQYLADTQVRSSKEYLLELEIAKFGGLEVLEKNPDLSSKILKTQSQLKCTEANSKFSLEPIMIQESELTALLPKAEDLPKVNNEEEKEKTAIKNTVKDGPTSRTGGDFNFTPIITAFFSLALLLGLNKKTFKSRK